MCYVRMFVPSHKYMCMCHTAITYVTLCSAVILHQSLVSGHKHLFVALKPYHLMTCRSPASAIP